MRQTSNYRRLSDTAEARIRRQRHKLIIPVSDTLNRITAEILGDACIKRTLRYTRPPAFRNLGKTILGRRWY